MPDAKYKIKRGVCEKKLKQSVASTYTIETMQLLWLLFICQSVCLRHTAAKLQEAKSMGEVGLRQHESMDESNHSYADYRAQQVDADNNQLRVEQKQKQKPKPKKKIGAKIPAVQVKVTNEVESAMMMTMMGATDDEVNQWLRRLRQPNGNGHNKAISDIQNIMDNSSGPDGDDELVGVGNALMSPNALPISERHNFDDNNNNNNSHTAGQMAGDEQLLRLQDYNLLYNAERQTYFQLHSCNNGPAAAATVTATMSSSGNRRLLHQVVGNTLSAAFGLNTNEVKDTNIQMTTQTVQLYDAISLRQSRFNPFNPTRIIIHGWLGNAHANVYSYLVPAYLSLGDGNYNIFTVDWGRGAIADYITASYRVKPVGQVLAKFLDFLHMEAGMRYEDLQLIGFSMGAHVAGLASKHVQTGRVRVIRALDPALPFFRYAQEKERLAKGDADYIEVLHTSVGSYGFDRPLGHVDFYANWGSQQPGCFWHECSHWRAFALFKESLESLGAAFVAKGCPPSDWQELTRFRRCTQPTGQRLHMGGDLGELSMEQLAQREGVYYFDTKAMPPYDALQQEQLE